MIRLLGKFNCNAATGIKTSVYFLHNIVRFYETAYLINFKFSLQYHYDEYPIGDADIRTITFNRYT